jgi:biopolymer transport protein ExbB
MQALVTTAAGLAVAVPCYVAFSFLVGKVEKIVLDMERAASEILGFLTGTEMAPGKDQAGH